MIRHSYFFLLVLIFVFPISVFPQQVPAASGLRDYVGLINKSYHPDIVVFFEKIKADLAKSKGNEDVIKAIDIFLRGDSGSGFVYSDARGNLYVLTNDHVISQASTLSITFERQDGYKRRFDNLRIIAADEELDLAILAFPAADRPTTRGMSFLDRPVQEGEDVFSAGFPGLGITPIWQFGRGMVSNAAARFQKSISDETLMGPFIQHTAQVDPGNSGGPLLVVQQNAPSGYAVAGINTLVAVGRQAANYSIPVNTAQDFINAALNPRPETYRDTLDQRLTKFVEGLAGNRAVYPHIAKYLSSACVGENAEYAMSEMYDKGNASVRRAFIEKTEDSVVGAMGYAVAWIIENSFRSSGTIKASIKEITGAGEEYTVIFTINNKEHSSKWIREYSNWRIRSFGTVAAGDKKLLSRKLSKRETEKKLRLGSAFHIDTGYAYLLEKESSVLFASAEFFYYNFGTQLYYAGTDYWSIGLYGFYRADIPVGSFGLMPFVRLGFDYQNDKEYKDAIGSDLEIGFPIAFYGQAGIKITTAHVPGLYMGAGYQYNLFNWHDDKFNKTPLKRAVWFNVGYAF
ncbi:MAG: S1C family serine protease [Treponema sp.]|jgi:serine protease Do|nr:S1C family serine protease [Treponema sp.]